MKVSLSRKIHIIALPHATWKACWSDDQSAMSWRMRPPPAVAEPGVAGMAGELMGFALVWLCERRRAAPSGRAADHARHIGRDPGEAGEQRQPDEEQEVPVARAQC